MCWNACLCYLKQSEKSLAFYLIWARALWMMLKLVSFFFYKGFLTLSGCVCITVAGGSWDSRQCYCMCDQRHTLIDRRAGAAACRACCAMGQRNWNSVRWWKFFYLAYLGSQGIIEISCTGTTSPTNQPRKNHFHLSSLSPQLLIHLSFNSQQGPPLSSLFVCDSGSRFFCVL